MITPEIATGTQPQTATDATLNPEKRLLVLLPTYNEKENITRMLATLFEQNIEGLNVLVIDDNSPDGTGEQVEDLAKSFYPEKLKVLHRAGKLGLGTAYIEGFQYALENNYPFVAHMDADFSHDPAVLRQLLNSLQTADVAIGSRYTKGGSLDPRWKFARRLLSRWGSIYSRFILGLKVEDTTAGFKMFRAEVLETLPLHHVRSNGYCFQVEIAYLCQKYGFKVAEVPIHFLERVAGTSKMSLAIAFEAAWRMWQLRFKKY